MSSRLKRVLTRLTGAVSDKFLNGGVTAPVISQVCSPDTGDMFYMLHQKGEGGAMTVATL